MDEATAIIIAVIGSGAFTTIIQAVLHKMSDGKRTKTTLAAVSYWVLSNELERLLSKGWASPAERRTVQILFNAYKANKWNGDMDARMERLVHMPTADLKEEQKK